MVVINHAWVRGVATWIAPEQRTWSMFTKGSRQGSQAQALARTRQWVWTGMSAQTDIHALVPMASMKRARRMSRVSPDHLRYPGSMWTGTTCNLSASREMPTDTNQAAR